MGTGSPASGDALAVLSRLLASGAAPPMLLGTLVGHFRRLVQVADGDAPPGDSNYREVQVLVPEGDGLFLAVDTPVQARFDESGIGPNRTYKMPPMPTGQAIVVRLRPHQFLTAMSESGTVMLALIVEYIED